MIKYPLQIVYGKRKTEEEKLVYMIRLYRSRGRPLDVKRLEDKLKQLRQEKLVTV